MLTFRPGEAPNWEIALFDDDEETRALDFTGGEISIHASSFSFTPAVSWADAAAGIALLAFTEAQTTPLASRTRHWIQLRLETPNGQPIITGRVPVLVK